MTLIRRTCSLLVLTPLLACASDNLLLPPGGLRYSVALAACGPADGPALMIFLTRKPTDGPNPGPTPYVRVYIPDATKVDGHAMSVSGFSPEADASFVREDTPSRTVAEDPSSGFLAISRSATDEKIVGIVDITFVTAGRVKGPIDARLYPNTAFCN